MHFINSLSFIILKFFIICLYERFAVGIGTSDADDDAPHDDDDEENDNVVRCVTSENLFYDLPFAYTTVERNHYLTL